MLAQVTLRIVPLIGCTFLANMGALVSDVVRAVTVYNTAAVSSRDPYTTYCHDFAPLSHNPSLSLLSLSLHA